MRQVSHDAPERGWCLVWAIKGRIVPLATGDETSTFAGRVWIDGDRVVAVTRGTKKGPPGSEDATVVDAGSDLVLPGFVDLHNHLAYNTLPLWVQPDRDEPFGHHDNWPSAKSYAAAVTWPAYALVTAAPEELLAYVETKALVGGTTTIQGSPPKNRPRDGWLVRNVEDERFDTGDDDLVYAATLTAKNDQLAKRANTMRAGRLFVYHCAEGRRDRLVTREFDAAAEAGCLQERFVAVHASAVRGSAFARWTKPGAIAWSPFSNLWLYGETTAVPDALARGIAVCLGSDWAPSGTKHVLGEAKVARLVADLFGWDLTDADIVRMMTCVPGDVLRRAWPVQVGRLQPGAIADVVVVDAKPGVNAFKRVVAATERDVRLVVVNGKPAYGTKALMTSAGATTTTTVKVAGESRTLSLTRPDDPARTWRFGDVVARLEEVRDDPKKHIEAAQARLAAWAGRLDAREAPLRLALDMPTGVAPVGGLPKDLGVVQVPPLETLAHDDEWLASLAGRGFHGGVLDGLAEYYS
jgi:cytosine/adenosine deaminase-related metal-dependent hydrolase